MSYTVIILPVVVPALFWAGYHYYKDRHLPEPFGHLLLAFALGVGSFYLGKLMYQALGLVNLRYDAYLLAETSLPGLFVYAIGVIGVIEELAKIIPFLVVIIHFREFNEPIDGIIYASFIALGFSFVENIQYIQYLTDSEALKRGFVSPVVHIVFSSIWGYYIGKACLYRQKLGVITVLALVFTAALHGIYDFIVIAMPAPALPIAAALIVGIWLWRLHLIRDLHTAPAGPCSEEDDPLPG